MIKVGVIGFGLSAQTFHFPFILSSNDFQLTAISTSKKEQVSAKLPQVLCFSKAEALITSKTVSLVVITAPNDVHFSLTKQCLLQGLHVIVEKPMTISSTEASELAKLASAQGLMLSVFHNRRWDGDFLTVKKLINENTLGKLKVFESNFNRLRPKVGQKWKEAPGVGTGVWYDLGSHLVDQALVLFGLPYAITARCLALRDNSKATDYFHVKLHYHDLEVILGSSPFIAGSSNRFDIQGNNGRFVKQGLDVQEAQLKQEILPTSVTYGLDEQNHYGTYYHKDTSTLITTERGCYDQYYQQIAQAINFGEPAPVSAVEGVHVIKILEVASLSNLTGKTIFLE